MASGLASMVAFVPFAILSILLPGVPFAVAASVILVTWYFAFKWIGDRICALVLNGTVGIQGDLLTVAGAQGSRVVRLSEVRAVDALRTDDLRIDTVWVRVWTPNGAIEFSEDFENFERAMEALVRLLPKSNAGWFESVISKNPIDSQTLIWARQSGQPAV